MEFDESTVVLLVLLLVEADSDGIGYRASPDLDDKANRR